MLILLKTLRTMLIPFVAGLAWIYSILNDYILYKELQRGKYENADKERN